MKKITKIEPSGEHIAARKLRVAAYCRVSTDMEIQLATRRYAGPQRYANNNHGKGQHDGT